MLKRLGEILNRTLPIFAFIGLLACSGIGSLAPGNNLAAPNKGPDAVGDAGAGGAGAGGGGGGGGGGGAGGSGESSAGSTEGGTPLTVYASTGNSGITQLGGGANSGGPYQPTSEGHAQTGSFLYARAIPATADHDQECSGMVGSEGHNDFTEPFPQVTVWFSNSAGGPWAHPDTWSSDVCGYRPLYCEYFDRDEHDLPVTVKPDFMKVQAVYDIPMVMTFPPKPAQHFESCPRIIDCRQFVQTPTEVPLKLFEGIPNCEGP